VLLYVIPGDAALARLGGEGAQELSPEQIQKMRVQLGLDAPLPIQYLQRLSGVFVGNLGLSLRSDQPVTEVLGSAIPPTLALAGFGLLLALVFGVAFAILSNLVRFRWLRSIFLSFPALGMGVPAFWVGILLISVFSFTLKLLPAQGNATIAALILPAITLALMPSAMIAQVFGTSLHESLQQVYASTTSPAKGASRARVIFVHSARNAAIPALTAAGLVVGNMLAGSVIVETVFSRAGIGRTMLDGVQALDFPVVQGVVLMSASTFVIVNLLVDLAYPLLDPRMRGSATPRAANTGGTR
jgi:peptide/nickel transport system permease protein